LKKQDIFGSREQNGSLFIGAVPGASL